MEYCDYNLNEYFLHFYECTENLINKYKFIKKCSISRFIHKLKYKHSKYFLEGLFKVLYAENPDLQYNDSVKKVKKNMDKILVIMDRFPKDLHYEKEDMSINFEYENSRKYKLKIKVKEDKIDYLIFNEDDNIVKGTYIEIEKYREIAKVIINFLYYNQY